MVLALTHQHLSELSAHAERVYPEECCGLMLGELDGASAQKRLIELVPLENKWFDDESVSEKLTKERRYTIDPRDMLRVQKQAREKGLKIIGIYHSHPDHVAVPSECDRAQAWPEYAYTIVSVQRSAQGKENAAKAVDVKTWALDSNHQFQPEPMNVSHSSIPAFATNRMPVSARTFL